MKTEFNVTGSERRRLAQTVAQSTGEEARYLGVPSMAYEIGPFTVSRTGTLEFDDRTDSETVEKLYDDLAAAGFDFEKPETPAAETSLEGEPCGIGLTVMLPADTMTENAVKNLNAILAAKGNLIKKALGIGSLPVDISEKLVSFPWFEEKTLTAEEVHAYTRFISALCEMAKNQKRITAKEKDVDNDKYAFRCFLLRLGFIGSEYKAERKILLRNLTGSSAFKGVSE